MIIIAIIQSIRTIKKNLTDIPPIKFRKVRLTREKIYEHLTWLCFKTFNVNLET